MHNLKFTAESWCQCGELGRLRRPLFSLAEKIFFFIMGKKLTILFSKITAFLPISLLG